MEKSKVDKSRLLEKIFLSPELGQYDQNGP